MLVKAIRLGFFGNKRVKAGQFFHIKSEKEFSKEWMEKADLEEPVEKKSKKKTAVEVVEFDEESKKTDAELDVI